MYYNFSTITPSLGLQYNEFAIQNVLSTLEFKNLGNIVLTNPDFIPRLQQVLVRDGLCTDPIHLQCEKDPVDAALDIIRCKFYFSLFLLYASCRWKEKTVFAPSHRIAAKERRKKCIWPFQEIIIKQECFFLVLCFSLELNRCSMSSTSQKTIWYFVFFE